MPSSNPLDDNTLQAIFYFTHICNLKPKNIKYMHDLSLEILTNTLKLSNTGDLSKSL